MRALLGLALWPLLAGVAYAHGDGLPVGPYDLWHHWTLDPWIWAPLLVGHWLYGRGVLRAWVRAGDGRIIARWRVVAFVVGEIGIVVALISPLDALGETLLAAHMAQHILLTTAAPLLLVLGMPATAWTWALPAKWRTWARTPAPRFLVSVWERLTRPVIATALHAVALLAWHVPILFDSALRDENVHTWEHITFFVSALLFWSAMFRRYTAPAFAAFLVLVVFVVCGMLGAVLALAPAPLYAYGEAALLWNLTTLQDQQIAGLIMWGPAGAAYMAPFVALGARVLRMAGARA
jgi:putative membrane protein